MEADRTPGPEDALDALLDLLSGDDAAREQRLLGAHPDLTRLAGAARAVAEVATVQPTPAVAAEHVRRIMDAAAAHAGPQAVAVAAPRRRRLRRSLASVGALVALLLVGAPLTAALASGAQPGQALYGAKLFVEKVELVVQRDPAQRVALRLKFARERLDEIRRLVAAGDTGRVGPILAALSDEQAKAAAALTQLEHTGKAPPALVQQLSALVAQHQDRLQSLDARCRAGTLGPAQCAAVATATNKADGVARTLRRIERDAGVTPAPGTTTGAGGTPGGNGGNAGDGGGPGSARGDGSGGGPGDGSGDGANGGGGPPNPGPSPSHRRVPGDDRTPEADDATTPGPTPSVRLEASPTPSATVTASVTPSGDDGPAPTPSQSPRRRRPGR